MRIKVDFDACESNGLCESLAPDHFRLDDDDYLQVSEDPVSGDDRASVEQAVNACPKSAITLVED